MAIPPNLQVMSPSALALGGGEEKVDDNMGMVPATGSPVTLPSALALRRQLYP